MGNVSNLIRSCTCVSRNYLILIKRPMRLCDSLFYVESFISTMVRVNSRSVLNQFLSMMHPKNFASIMRKVHFFGFSSNFQRVTKSCPSPFMYSANVLA